MKKQLLIADEDDSVRRLVARVLESAGYAVTCTRNGLEAVRCLRNALPDLVLLDLATPKPEGWQVVEQINRCYPRLPVILMTALSNQQEIAQQRGIRALMEKPLDLAALLQTIETLLVRQAPIGQDVRV